ncbi:MAG: N-acetyltransferase, partial [Clostridia bacterium]|nr:N-acetyltransferase [Clostridia bacterium]
YYNAYRGGQMVGRISGILQKAANEKNGERRVRFTRFDSIDDTEVSDALFGAVEEWALSKGMDTVVGPLGFSDLEREGLLIEGFDELSTFEEQYNAPYYQRLIEARGYVKEVDWTESRIYPPEKDDGSLKRVADKLLKRYDLHFGEAKNVNDFLSKYADGFFEILDKSYDSLYGTVPFTPGMKKLMIDNFKLIIDLDHVGAVLDSTGKVVCIGICFPSIAKAVQKSNGQLTPAALVRLLRAIKHPEIIDLGLIGVDPDWAMRGVSVAICAELERMLRAPGIKYAETNLNLENNAMIQNQWKRFREVKHKRRRSFVKKLDGEEV